MSGLVCECGHGSGGHFPGGTRVCAHRCPCIAYSPVSLSDAEATVPPVADPSAGTDPVDTPTSAGSATVEAEQVGRAIADWALDWYLLTPPDALASEMESWSLRVWAFAAERAGVACPSSAAQAHAIRLVREGRTPAPVDDLAARIEAVAARHEDAADALCDEVSLAERAMYLLHRCIAAELRQALAGEA